MFRWHREGNYFQFKKYDVAYEKSLNQSNVPHHRRIKNNVFFINRHINAKQPVTIKVIEAICYRNNQIFVRLRPSYFKKNIFFETCQKLIKSPKKYYPSIAPAEIEIPLTKISLNELNRVFAYFNQTAVEFPVVLQHELQQILAYHSETLKTGADVYQHILPHNGFMEDFINPEKIYSDELLQLLLRQKKLTPAIRGVLFKEISALLVNGVSPNYAIGTESPLTLALSLLSPEMISLLLTYGANPNKYDIFYESFIEKIQWHLDCALETGKKVILKRILDILNSPSPFQSAKSFLQITSIQLISDKNAFKRLIQFENDDSITTCLTASYDLSQLEREGLFNYFLTVFYHKNYSPVSKEKLKTIFTEDFFGEKHLIEIMKKDNKIVGFNVLELIPWHDKIDDDNKEHLTLHVVFSACDYRGLGLVDLSTVGLAFALHGIYPSIITSLYCTAISVASFDALQCYKFFPKNKTSKLKKDVAKLLKHIYGDNLQWVNDETMTSYVVENISVNKNYQKLTHKHFLSELYDAIVDNDSKKADESRGATLLLYTSDVLNFNTLHAKLARSGVNFRRHFSEFCHALVPLVSRILEKQPEIRPFYLCDTTDLFWKNRITPMIPQKMEEEKEVFSPQSKL